MIRPITIQNLLISCAAVVTASAASARMSITQDPFANVFSPIPLVSPANLADRMVAGTKREQMVREFCTKVNAQFRRYQWNEDACGKVAWRAEVSSKNGAPLIYAEFGSGKSGTTLLLGGVHPDELTPVPIAFRAARHLAEHPELLAEGGRVIVAPLVNPDGFLKQIPTRTNGNGIDLNRNFFTMDWYEKAKKLWIERRSSVASHFPGHFPNSEIETIFQIQLVDMYRPDKILSIHAPLGFLDYDGPGDGRPRMLSTTQVRAKRLVTAISEKSNNYKVVDYSFYPGSLGNFAGNERHIPTVTLELETTDPSKIEVYWNQFLPGILQAVRYPFVSPKEIDAEKGADASPFSAQYYMVPNKTI
jgi:murein peptide amidase A